MKKLVITMLTFILAVTFLSGCNTVTRKFGGNQTIVLEKGQKLEMVTWKEDSLWILTRDMRPDEQPESYIFSEDSNFGVLEGAVKLIESKEAK